MEEILGRRERLIRRKDQSDRERERESEREK